MSDRTIITVTELNNFIKDSVDNNVILNNVLLRGEISNFTNHRAGHLYFTLKDETSRLQSVMFVREASKLPFVPANGMRVIAGGRISVFVSSGAYQLYASTLEPDGVGALYVAYEQLKAKLASEGLFDVSKKRTLPRHPSRIGVITSPTGAAIRDIINILSRRYKMAEVILYPSLVQGEGAPENLIAGLRHFAANPVDVIIIGRGGGSIEDLWAFNNEALARAVAASKIPIISAVGHETDFTICDFAADRRAPTPSAAAELAAPDVAELSRQLGNVRGVMGRHLRNQISTARMRVNALAHVRALSSPRAYLDDRRMSLLHLGARFDASIERRLTAAHAALTAQVAAVEAMSPLKVLSRGYSAAFTSDGRVVSSAGALSPGDRLTLRMRDGVVRAQTIDSKVEI